MRTTTESGSWLTRLAWFVGLWVAGVAAVGIAAEAIRWVLRPG